MKRIIKHLRTLIGLILGLAMFSSCEFREMLTYDEIYLKHMAVFDYDIDWSDLSEKPTGLTMIFYPIESEDTKVYKFHSNTVDHFHAVLPDQDYSIVCFNQSEEEFMLLKFENLDTFDGASIVARSEEEIDEFTHIRYRSGNTRGFNASGVLRPGTVAVASMSSAKSGSKLTKGYNASGVLRPGDPVSTMSMNIHVVGLQYTKKVVGVMSGLSAGLRMSDKTPLAMTLNQKVSDWTINRPATDKEAGSITASFGTFGLPVNGSRAGGDFEDNVLQLTFIMNDDTEVNFEIDMTEDVREQYEEFYYNGGAEVEGEALVIEVEIGADTSSGDPLEDNPDGTMSNGNLVLHRTEASGFHIGVQGWGEEIVTEIKF